MIIILMDIEDLFNEETLSESKESPPMVIPEFGPCSGDGNSESKQAGAGAALSTHSLSCSTLQPCDCEKKQHTSIAPKAADPMCFKCKTKAPSLTNK
jgi:hypothetical protein